MSPALSTPTETVPAPVPPAGETVSQLASSLTVHASVPPLPLLMASDLAAGVGPPTDAENARLVGLTTSAGVDETKVSVTGIVAGAPAAPSAATVIAPE